MEKQSENIDRITNKIIKDAGLHQPSVDFFSNVMEAIESQSTSASIVYKPLISKTVWVLIFAITAVVLALLLVFPVFTETSYLNQLVIPEVYKFSLPEFSFPKFHFSEITIYGIGFLSLFLLYIPFISRQRFSYS